MVDFVVFVSVIGILVFVGLAHNKDINLNSLNESIKKPRKWYKYVVYILASGLLILMITNPTPSEFKAFIYSDVYDVTGKLVTARKRNYIVYSVYEYQVYNIKKKKKKEEAELIENGYYIGLFKNFYRK